MIVLFVLFTACGDGGGGNGGSDSAPNKTPGSVTKSSFRYKPDPDQFASKTLFTIGDTDNPYLFIVDGIDSTADISSDLKITLYNADNTAGTAKTVIIPDKGMIPGSNPAAVGIGIPASKNIDFTNRPQKLLIVAEGTVNGVYDKREVAVDKAGDGDLYSWRDLDKVRTKLNGNYTMKNNIAFPKDNTYGYGTTFTPIGDDGNRFRGNFDGGGFTLSNLKIDEPAKDYVGLFGYIKGTADTKAIVKNITVDHNGIRGKNYVGAVAGAAKHAKITNVVMKSTGGASINGVGNVGGLTGQVDGSTFSGYATGNVSGSGNYVGGLVGELINGTLKGYAKGAVTGKNRVGGLIGDSSGMINGYATGAVTGSFYVGGLVGISEEGATVSGYATDTVTGIWWTGGLIGKISVPSDKLTGYARGTVKQTWVSGGEKSLGLLVGKNENGTVKGYHSKTESKILSSTTGNPTGVNGNPIDMSTDITKSDFDVSNDTNPGYFKFGTADGEWTWIDGRWPAINLPATVGGNYKPEDQPTQKILKP